MMRMVIDLQACQSSSRFRGIGRYSKSMAQAMARHAGPHEIWLALNAYVKDDIIAIRQSFQDLVPPERVAVFSIPGPCAGIDYLHAWRVRAAELIRWHALAQLKPDMVYLTSLFEGFVDYIATSIEPDETAAPHAVTLYDLIPLKSPHQHLKTPIHRQWYFNKIASLKRARLLLAISEYTRNEAIEALKLPAERIVNVYAGVSEHFRPLSLSADQANEFLMRYSITRPFLLYTGNLDANKNLKGTIQAYAKLPSELRQKHQLVIVSQMNPENLLYYNRYRQKCGLEDNAVVFTGYIPDDHLVWLYNLCKAFVFSSLHEGFGLPVLEAMSCGAACIGSNTTSIPEVIGRPDALFDPHNTRAMARAMHKALTDQGFRHSLREHAIVQAQRFSWDNTAKKAWASLEELHQPRNSHPTRTRSSRENSPTGRNSDYIRLIDAIASIQAGIEPSEQDICKAAESISNNEMASGQKQLFVDVSTIIVQDSKTGIQRVVRSILRQLLDNPIAGYTVKPVYGDDKIGYFRYAGKFQAQLRGEVDVETSNSVINYKRGDVFLGLDLTAHLFPIFTPVLSNFRAIGVKVHFVVYDILPLLHRHWFVPGMHEAFIHWMEAISGHADGLMCISAAVAQDVRRWLAQYPPQRPDTIHIDHFGLGADIDQSIPTSGMPENATILLSKLKSNPTFLMVGTIEPRKGHPQVLAAFEQLWQQGTNANLVIVGKAGWSMESFLNQIQAHKELNSRLYWLAGISDEFLKEIYQSSSALIAASEAEGFGLPLIEAAQYQLPIIARDIAVFREVAGSNAYYFQGPKSSDLSEAIIKWLALYEAEQAPKSCGISWLTWEQSAKLLLEGIFKRSQAAPSNANAMN